MREARGLGWVRLTALLETREEGQLAPEGKATERGAQFGHRSYDRGGRQGCDGRTLTPPILPRTDAATWCRDAW